MIKFTLSKLEIFASFDNFLKDNGKELLDVIALKCNMPTFKIVGILLSMELKGVVKHLRGKLFEVI